MTSSFSFGEENTPIFEGNNFFSTDSSILFQEDQCSPISSPFLLSEEAALAEQLLCSASTSSVSEQSSPGMSPSSDLDLLLPDFILTGVEDPSSIQALEETDQEPVIKEETKSKKARTRKRQRKDESSKVYSINEV
jgi:hypothetical protein